MMTIFSMILVFSSLWLVSIATPVFNSLDQHFWMQSSKDFVSGTPLTEEMKGNFSDIKDEFLEDFFQWEKQDPALYEGDIMFLGDKNAILSSSYRWPNATIPYEISNVYTSDQRKVIAFGMNEYHENTCIKFVPRTSEKNYIRIYKKGSGCSSYVGMVNIGSQDVSLDDGCVSRIRPGIVLHELMHAAGFFHEHTRPDRDTFVRINFENILEKHVFNFNTNDASKVTTLGLPYDYDSVMHYSRYAFAIDKTRPTITPVPNENVEIGNRRKFSSLDLLKLNALYCSEVK
ncbi:low choriolytic enzyme-like [Daphnia pulex]|uniref:low choriolytic enzyme-like n=1 Tax=Daphnia pulex TaxID=6669 RepID=UPI001EE03E53|nr:low choriolytic enzyme-like [Daphnia pulex]XP_046443280.1 low choriolytic enzyme-like [Daphnia pulex]XP_046443281.1 low choriolytic enzyme-like [Daphnia pulex]